MAKMTEYEIHARVSYKTDGGDTYNEYYLEYEVATSKTQAIKQYKAYLKKNGIKLLEAEIIEA